MGAGDDENEEEQMEDEGSEDGASIAPSGMGTEDHWDVSSNMTMEVPTSEVIAAEKRRREVLLKRSEEELEFPDEVDTPLEVPARERFQRYRGLKSFRTSSWDPYEDLPVEYSRIWEFEAFGGRRYVRPSVERKVPLPDMRPGTSGGERRSWSHSATTTVERPPTSRQAFEDSPDVVVRADRKRVAHAGTCVGPGLAEDRDVSKTRAMPPRQISQDSADGRLGLPEVRRTVILGS
eukprot:symbB.v1.2.035193.t1/scaffold4684.1/size36451/1